MPTVINFYYKAYTESGHKRTGTIEAFDTRTADAQLRKSGLRPYLIKDYDALRLYLKKRKKRHKRMAIGIVASIVLTSVLSVVMVAYAGREKAPDIEQYKEAGLLTESDEQIIGKSDAEREFALDMLDMWEGFCPGAVTSIEARKVLMTVYTNKNIREVPDNDLEVLATNTVRTLHRRLGGNVCTLLVVEDDMTILEVGYVSLTKSTRVKFFR